MAILIACVRLQQRLDQVLRIAVFGHVKVAAIHDQFQDVQGLIWTSRRCDPHSAMLFFGGRTAETDLQIVSVRDGVDSSFLR